MTPVRKMALVLERRETKARLALARLTCELDQKRARVRAMTQLIEALRVRMEASLAGRYSSGPRTVAALMELEQHMHVLHTSAEQVAVLAARAQHDADELTRLQQAAARQWRRSELRLGHVASLARRERITSALLASELDDELHAERRAAARRTA
jgi:hypothetical protein